MKRFRYVLEPALAAATASERAAAAARAASVRICADACAEVERIAGIAHASVMRASAAGSGRVPPASVPALHDREAFFVGLAHRAERAAAAAARATSALARADAALATQTQRRSAFESHRDRARVAYQAGVDLVEAAEFDEANAGGYEARLNLLGRSVA